MAQAQVSLKSYCDEVRDLIKKGTYDEALVTGRYILQHYPKYVEAYHLLAEACQGKGQYDEASDLFARVLSVDPENVSARMGMSKLFEAKGDIDSAVLQMREAFDLAPSQTGIRTELHRLLRRQGGEVTRLKLTRQGLGRIYLRGGLYTQAADEFETLLREDADQIDVEVSLAEALWRDGQLIRSVEVCQGALNKLPYCLKANLILAETWMRSDREDEGETHLQRVRMVDPEGELAHQLLGVSTLIPQVSVMLTRMGEAPAPTPAPAGAAMEDLAEAEGVPDWLKEATPDAPAEDLSLPAADAIVMGATATTGPTAAPVPTEEPTLETSDLPDWLKKVRRDELADAEKASATPAAEEPTTPGEGEIPPWISEETGDEIAEQELPPWLAEAAAQPAETTPAESEEIIAEELPDWLAEAAEAEQAQTEAPTEDAAEAEQAQTEAPTEDAAESGAPEAEVEEVEEEEPAWRRILRDEGLEVDLPAEQDVAAPEPQPGEEPEDLGELTDVLDEDQIPDWLREAWAREKGAEPAAPAPTADVQSPVAPEEIEEVPGWLKDEAATEAAGPSSETVEAEEEIPDWLRLLREEGLESELPSEEQLAAAGLVAEQASAPETPSEIEEPAAAGEETPDWLRMLREESPEPELPPEQEPSWKRILRGQEMGVVSQQHLEEAGLIQEEAEAEPEAAQPEAPEAEEIPEWLRQAAMEEGLVEASAAEVSPAEEAAPATEVVPVPEPPASSPAEAAPAKPAPDWLDVLRADGLAEAILPEGPAPAEAAAPTVEAKAVTGETEEVPTWMKMLRQARGEPVAPETDVKTEDKPEWLQQLAQSRAASEPAPEVATAAIAEAAPDWLADLKSEAAAGEEPTEAAEPAPETDTAPGAQIDAAIIAGYEKAVQTNPKDYLTRWKLTQAYAAAGNHEAAIAHSQKLLEADEMVPQVAEYLKSAVDSGVQTRQAYQLLGDAYFKGGHLEEALDAYRKALSLLY